MNKNGLQAKAFNDGYPYKDGHVIMRATYQNPVNRYVKNYFKFNKKFSLCIISTENNVKRMEAWLDDRADKIMQSDIEPKFKLLGIKYEP